MNVITTRTVSIYETSGYCSQKRKTFPPIETIKEGVAIIEMLLEKKILCGHDVEEINKAYQTINDLEKRSFEFSYDGSLDALNKVIDKVKKIAKFGLNISDNDLISLYHLQNFSDKDLKIDTCFNNLLQLLKDKRCFNGLEVAISLPYCYSEKHFITDADAFFKEDEKKVESTFSKFSYLFKTFSSLLSTNVKDPIDIILTQKKNKFKSYNDLKNTIIEMQSDFNKNKNKSVNKDDDKSLITKTIELFSKKNYPDYCGELIDNGYIHLCNHLAEMTEHSDRNKRIDGIKKMSFSEISHVILEMREAVVRKVENSIPLDFDYSKIIFLLGASGSGKSTTLCFLRGDKMVYREDSHDYISTNSTTIIGDNNAKSCTLLPNIEIVNGFAIVDFAGFEDTNGSLISMGMEFALQALVNKYQPKVLVLESITNDEGRYAAAGRLGARLERLYGETKEFCMLGITKYSKDANYKELLATKNKKKDCENLENKITNAKKELANLEEQLEKSEGLSKDKIKEINKSIFKQEGKIESLEEQYNEKKKDNEDLKKKLVDQKEKIIATENELLGQIGLKETMRFVELNDWSQYSECFKTFSSIQNDKRIHTNPKKELDTEHTKLLKELFNSNLVKVITNQQAGISWCKAMEFKAAVWESSLIKNILIDAHPEIVELIHLPEIDPKIIHSFDKEIVDECIDGYINSCFGLIDQTHFDLLMQVLQNDTLKNELKKNKDQLQKYVMWFVKNDTDKNKLLENWKTEQLKRKKRIEGDYELPRWSKIVLGSAFLFPWGIAEGIQYIRRRNALQASDEAEKQKLIKFATEYCQQLNSTYHALKKLNDLKDIINRKQTVDEIIRSKTIATDSFNSLLSSVKDRIAEMRKQFGSNDWDEHISSLAKSYNREDFDSKNLFHCLCVLAYAYFLIEPNLHFEFLAPPLSKIDKPWEIQVSEGGNKIIAISPKKNMKIPTFFKDIQQIDYGLHPLTNLWSAAAILKTFSFDKIPDNSEGLFSVVLNGKAFLK